MHLAVVTTTTTNGPAWLVYGILGLFVLVVAWIVYSKIHQRGEAWEGVVIDKHSNTNVVSNPNSSQNTVSVGSFNIGSNPTGVQMTYTLEIKTDDGKQISFPVGQGIFDSANIGDRFVKRAGVMEPERISAAASSETPTDQTPPANPDQPAVS